MLSRRSASREVGRSGYTRKAVVRAHQRHGPYGETSSPPEIRLGARCVQSVRKVHVWRGVCVARRVPQGMASCGAQRAGFSSNDILKW